MTQIESIQIQDKSIPVLIVNDVKPIDKDRTSVLLFLHGRDEASTDPGELPKVCFNLSPPFRALMGQFAWGLTVVTPQAPAMPKEDWNWRTYTGALTQCREERFSGRRLLATGFSRGGLGVLQLRKCCPHRPPTVRQDRPLSPLRHSVARRSCSIGRFLSRFRANRSRGCSWSRRPDLLYSPSLGRWQSTRRGCPVSLARVPPSQPPEPAPWSNRRTGDTRSTQRW